ncbi:RRP12-like protein [Aphelenchoides fujianensis]|nr:RRP12-like protein [Aphelenchoides fujianensis]
MGKGGYRYRPHSAKAHMKIRKGKSSSSNPALSQFREMAKAERRAKLQLVAVDDRPPQTKSTRHLDQQLDSMDLERPTRSKTGRSVVSFANNAEPLVINEKPRERTKSTSQAAEYSTDDLNLFATFLTSPAGSVDQLLPQKPEDAERAEFLTAFTRKLIPFLFRSYCSTDAPTTTITEKEWKLALLETIRAFVPLLTAEAVDKHVDAALQKLKNDEITTEQKWLIMDVLVALCRGRIVTSIGSWFTVPPSQKSEQKKAYRILAELFNRAEDPALAPFFSQITDMMDEIVHLDAKKVAPSAWASRLVVLRLAGVALPTVEGIKQLWDLVLDQVVGCMDKSHSRLTRQNAVRCFHALISAMLEKSGEEESARIQVLDAVEAGLFAYTGVKTTSGSQPLERIRAALIAMNLFAQKHLRSMNAALVSRFLSHAVLFVSDSRSPVRVVAVRLMRVFAKRLPDFMLRQYQEVILDAVFNGQTADENSSSVRRANRLLFEVLIEKFGYEVLCKVAGKQQGWLKFLKKLEKLRRTKKPKAGGAEEPDVDEADRTTVVSHTKSAKPDSIFYMDEMDEEEDDRQSRAERRSSVWIREGRGSDDEDVLDMLDEKSMIGRIVTKKPPKEPEAADGAASGTLGGFRLAQDGRLIIEEDEAADEESSARSFTPDCGRSDQSTGAPSAACVECVLLIFLLFAREAERTGDFFVQSRSDKKDGRGTHDHSVPTATIVAFFIETSGPLGRAPSLTHETPLDPKATCLKAASAFCRPPPGRYLGRRVDRPVRQGCLRAEGPQRRQPGRGRAAERTFVPRSARPNGSFASRLRFPESGRLAVWRVADPFKRSSARELPTHPPPARLFRVDRENTRACFDRRHASARLLIAPNGRPAEALDFVLGPSERKRAFFLRFSFFCLARAASRSAEFSARRSPSAAAPISALSGRRAARIFDELAHAARPSADQSTFTSFPSHALPAFCTLAAQSAATHSPPLPSSALLSAIMRLVKKAAMVAKRFLFPEERAEALDAAGGLLQPFRHQVAGHAGIYEVDHEHICKPYNQFEAEFYRQMPAVLRDKTPALCFEAQLKADAFTDDVDLCIVVENPDSRHEHPAELRVKRTADPLEGAEFRDVFSGLCSELNPWSLQCQMRTLKREQPLQRFLIFENLTARFHKPSVLDLKLGTRQYGESASEEKKDRQRRKCAKSTSSSHGIRLCGLQYYDEQLDSFQCVDKYEGRRLSAHGLRNFLVHFFRRSPRCPACDLYGVSLLIVMEGASQFYEENQPVVKLIDFATSCVNPDDSELDEGCLFGLTQLSLMLLDLVDGDAAPE